MPIEARNQKPQMNAIENFARALVLARDRPADRRAIIAEAKRCGIRFLPPHVNHSVGIDRIEDNAIRIGLLFVPGIWKPWVALACIWRGQQGRFKTVRSVLGPPSEPDSLPAQSAEGKTILQALHRAGALRGLRP